MLRDVGRVESQTPVKITGKLARAVITVKILRYSFPNEVILTIPFCVANHC